jgi:hypothetical protein
MQARKGIRRNLARIPERRHLFHLEATTKVAILVFHHLEPSNGQATTEPVCTTNYTFATTPNHVYTAAQPWWFGDVTDHRRTHSNQGDEVSAEFRRWRIGG